MAAGTIVTLWGLWSSINNSFIVVFFIAKEENNTKMLIVIYYKINCSDNLLLLMMTITERYNFWQIIKGSPYLKGNKIRSSGESYAYHQICFYFSTSTIMQAKYQFIIHPNFSVHQILKFSCQKQVPWPISKSFDLPSYLCWVFAKGLVGYGPMVP